MKHSLFLLFVFVASIISLQAQPEQFSTSSKKAAEHFKEALKQYRIREYDYALDKIREDLENQRVRVDEIDRKMNGVHEKIEETEGIPDWMNLASKVNDLEEDTLEQEVFDREIENLKDRLDDTSSFKKWSVRTLLEIILIIATIISASAAVGIL